MILARVEIENTPRFIWANQTDKNADKQNVPESNINSEEENDSCECPKRYEEIRCMDVRPIPGRELHNPLPKCVELKNNFDAETTNTKEYDFNPSESTIENVKSLGEDGAVEELWIVGNRQVEWRRGGKTVKRFTGQHTALQVLWSTFITDCKSSKSKMECIAIREKKRLRLYSDGGREFLVALPFSLRKIWNTKYGLLLERSEENTPKSSTHTTYSSHAEVAKEGIQGYRIKPPRLMALHHPLDDFTRIIVKTGRDNNVKFCEWNSNRHKILFTCCDPSVCVTFDNITGFHNIWHVRQICETDNFNEDMLRGAENDCSQSNCKDMQRNTETPSQLSSQPQTHLISNLLNNTRIKQFQKKQNSQISGIQSSSGSPSLFNSNCSPKTSRPTPNISANSCVMQQQKSQNSPNLHSSMTGVTGTSTRRPTPLRAGTRTFSFTCPDSPMTPYNQSIENASTNISTREFMMQHGTPICAVNPNPNMRGQKLSHGYVQLPTTLTRSTNMCRENQHIGTHATNTGKHNLPQPVFNNSTADSTNRFMSSRECDYGGTEQPLAPDFSICLEQVWSEEHASKSQNHESCKVGEDITERNHAFKPATKVFLCSDVTGIKYLCFFYKTKGIINVLPYHEAQNACKENTNKYLFGNFGQIGSMQNQQTRSILDAVPVDSLGMILTLERNEHCFESNEEANKSNHCTNICLYTGCTADSKVADVHIEPTYSGITKKGDLANIAHEISILHLDGKRELINQSTTTNDKRKLCWNEKSCLAIDPENSEKQGVVTSSRPPSASGFQAFNESILSMISPVAKSESNIQALPTHLPQSSSNQLKANPQQKTSKVEYGGYGRVKLFHNDMRLQLTLPPICTSSIIQRCLKCLYAYLPNRLSVELAIKWYRARNAPGPSSIGANEEWKLFIKCLFGQMGYRVDKLEPDIFSISSSCRSRNDSSMSPIYSKKMRPDETGSDSDWQTILEAQPHMQSGEKISFLIGIADVSRTQSSFTLENEEKSKRNENPRMLVTDMDVETILIDPDAILFEHIGSILWCLHLLYEDFKVDNSSLTYLSPMATVLSKLAADLKLGKYVDHYWKDFPMTCPKTISCAQTGQMLPQYLPVISKPFVIMKDGNSSLTTKHTTPPCIYTYLTTLIENEAGYLGHIDDRYEIMPRATGRSRDLIIIYAILSFQMKNPSKTTDAKLKISDYVKISRRSNLDKQNPSSDIVELIMNPEEKGHDTIDVASSIVRFVVDNRYNTWALVNSFPAIVALPIFAAMFECRLNPRLKDYSWAKEAYELIGRPDLAKRCLTLKSSIVDEPRQDESNILKNVDPSHEESQTNLQPNSARDILNNIENINGLNPADSTVSTVVSDGLESVESEVTRLRWPKDRRLADVRRMLQSARPVIIDVEQRPEMSDHDYVEVQERALQSLCVRTMALPIGRGALAFRTTEPLPTETLPVPKLCLSGRAPPRGATVEMDHIDVVPNMERWPSFHNGVAAGLRIAEGSGLSYVNSNWITFNKPKETSTNPNELVEHGGFLMALGLNGQLATLGKLESFDYMIRGNDMISIGILLGTCAAQRGSMDILATKKIATQVEALLPSTATELPLSNTTQVAGLAGLGLLYQGTGHRQMAEVCLMELGRPPGPEMENCTDRESYSLSAGLSLGMITLGKGEQLNKGPLSDLRLPETLYHHMVGGPRSPSVYRHRFRSPSSYQIQEGDTINIDITSPGATLALGLMFFNSGNKTYANWMNAPDSQFLLEFVRPDFLMVRTLAKGLIMWDSILPTSSWIDSHVPPSIRPYCLRRPGDDINTGQMGSRGIRGAVDYETINQAYCNIIAGAALAMGLRFAGSHNAQAFEVLHRITLRLLAISKRSVAELAGKATIEQTICVLVLSLAIVSAGSGDLEVIKIIRLLRSRVGPKNPTVTYGSHMALHMALGLLFLGGGRYTLSTSPEAVAAMVAAFFPKFPTHSNDNRYHLQALRHLYVLATEPRLLIPRDIHTGRLVFCHIELELKDTSWYKECVYTQKAPAFLPELKYLKKVSIKDPRYHEMVFRIDREYNGQGKLRIGSNANNFAQLRALLQDGFGILDIQQKAGSLSYQDDPQGFRSLTGQRLTKHTGFRWNISLNSSRLLSIFSLEPSVATFTNFFIKQIPGFSSTSNEDNAISVSSIEQIMAAILYECASQEKLDMLPFYTQIFQDLWNIGKPGQLLFGHQMKILVKLTTQRHSDCFEKRGLVNRLVNPEIVMSVYQGLQCKLDWFLKQYGVESAKQFLRTGKFDDEYFRYSKGHQKEQDQNSSRITYENATPWKRNAFASLLVLHQMMTEKAKNSTEKLFLHFSESLSKENNPLQMILQNKNDLNKTNY